MIDKKVKICPITGLSLTTSPNWENVQISPGHSVTYKIIENNILLGKAVGTTDLISLKKSLNIATKIIEENFNKRPFVYIEDFSKTKNSSVEGRKYYINYMKNLKTMKGLIYYNINPILSLSIKLAKKINYFGFDVYVSKNYINATELALTILNIQNENNLNKNIVKKNSFWDIEFNDYKVRHEIINENILHIISEGLLELKHTEPVFNYLDNFLKEKLQDKTREYYYAVDLNKVSLSRKCRKIYAKKIQSIFEKYPFKAYIYYGGDRLIDIIGVFISPFINFNIKKVDNLDGVLKYVKKDYNFKEKKIKKQIVSTETQEYIDEFLLFLAKINWEDHGIDKNFKKDSTHPFYQVYDAITLIKSDLDELYLEKKKNEEEKALLQNKLQQSLKLETMGKLAGSVAHDLNNVLGGIVSYPDIILKELPSNKKNEKPVKYIKRMKSSGQKAADIVQDLLTISRSGVVSCETTDMNHIITKYLKSPEYKSLTKENLKISIKLNLSDELNNIYASSIHISKTVMNLVINAFESISDKGVINISTKNISLVNKSFKGYNIKANGNYVELTVVDTGSGISEQDLPKIFEPFYSKKIIGKSGTGLGMMVIKGTVDDHNGFLSVNSKENRGTEFNLYFPVNNGHVEKKPSKTINIYTGRGETILVVDDVEDQRIIAYKLLKGMHYSVKTVSSGEEAIEYLKKENADLLVLDMIMEPGIGGLETYKQIKNIKPDQKAIIVSGYSKTEDVREVQRLGAGKYIRKPYTIEELGIAVFEELHKKQN